MASLIEASADRAPLAIGPPPSAEALAGARCAAWLSAACARLAASPRPLDRLAALGLVYRLWAPVDAQERSAAIVQVRAREPGLPERARAFIGAIDGPSLQRAESLAVAEADALREALPALRARAAGDPVAATEAARAWIWRRDDLESVLAVLRLGGAGEGLAATLSLLDEHAGRELTALGDVSDLAGDERIHAVAWQEPNSWWGTLWL